MGSASKDVKQTVEFVDERDKYDFLQRYLNTIEEVGLTTVYWLKHSIQLDVATSASTLAKCLVFCIQLWVVADGCLLWCMLQGLILVFVETKRKADSIEMNLSDEGYPSTSIHGDRSQVSIPPSSFLLPLAALLWMPLLLLSPVLLLLSPVDVCEASSQSLRHSCTA